eukprot:gene10189-15672_t
MLRRTLCSHFSVPNFKGKNVGGVTGSNTAIFNRNRSTLNSAKRHIHATVAMHGTSQASRHAMNPALTWVDAYKPIDTGYTSKDADAMNENRDETMDTDRPSYEVKVHAVFEEFDTEKSRSISKDAFAAAMARYQLQLSAATVSDLHDRADKNNDGVVSYVEWQQFAEMYPTLLDCLYYRGKDHQSNMQQKEAVDRQKEFIQRLRKAERDGRLAITNAQAQSDDAERKLQQQGQAVADANSKQGLAKNALDAAKADTEAARVVLNKRNGDLGVANDNQRRA